MPAPHRPLTQYLRGITRHPKYFKYFSKYCFNIETYSDHVNAQDVNGFIWQETGNIFYFCTSGLQYEQEDLFISPIPFSCPFNMQGFNFVVVPINLCYHYLDMYITT